MKSIGNACSVTSSEKATYDLQMHVRSFCEIIIMVGDTSYCINWKMHRCVWLLDRAFCLSELLPEIPSRLLPLLPHLHCDKISERRSDLIPLCLSGSSFLFSSCLRTNSTMEVDIGIVVIQAERQNDYI